MSRTSARDSLLAVGLGAGALLLYVSTLAPGVLEADAGEFQFAAYLAGIAHPTGYPLYLLLGWAWTHLLPFGSVAYRMNLLTAITSAVAVGLSARLLLVLLPEQTPAWMAWPAAALSAALLATSPTFWSQAIISEANPLNLALMLALLLAAFTAKGRPSRWWVVALVAGLGLAHHRTIVFLFPGVALAMFLQGRGFDQRSVPKWRRQLACAAVALLLPLLLYAYIPLRAPHTPYLRLRLGPAQELHLYDNTPAGFAGFITGTAFEGAITLRGLGQRALQGARWAVAELSPLVWLLAVVGAAYLWQRRRPEAVAILSAALLLLAFNLVYAIGDINIYYIPLYAFAALLAGAATIAIAEWLGRRWLAPATVAALALLLAVRVPAARAQALAAVPNPSPGRWPALLAAAPRDAILVSNDRNEIMPMWYYQYVERQRPDLIGLFPLIVPGPTYADIGGVLDQALASGRPVALIKPMPGLEVAYRLVDRGAYVSVLGPWQEAPQLSSDATLAGQVRLLGYDLYPEELKPGEQVTVTLYWQALQPLAMPYSSYVHVTRADGSVPFPGSDHRPGGDIYPATLWQPGQEIRDQHVLVVPQDAQPGDYRLIAGMYAYPSMRSLDGIITLGPLILGAGK